jgi:hypothetical protein
VLDLVQREKQIEESAIYGIHKRYLKKERNNTYIALEELDFTWSMEEVFEFEKMWNEGKSLMEIAEHFGRTHEEVAVLIMDRALKGKIKKRESGIWGREGHVKKSRKGYRVSKAVR